MADNIVMFGSLGGAAALQSQHQAVIYLEDLEGRWRTGQEKVLLITPRMDVLHGVSAALRNSKRYRLVAAAANLPKRQGIRATATIILLDLATENAAGLLFRAARRFPNSPILLIADPPHQACAVKLLASGARGCIETAGLHQLRQTLTVISSGGIPAPPQIISGLSQYLRNERLPIGICRNKRSGARKAELQKCPERRTFTP